MVKLLTKEPGNNVSFNGVTYPIVKGIVDVPAEAVTVLTESHGFVQVVEKSAPVTVPDETPAEDASETEDAAEVDVSAEAVADKKPTLKLGGGKK